MGERVLYYNTRLTWSGESSMSWNNSDENWTLGEYRCGNTDGMDVVFGDTGSGMVTLKGKLAPKSVLVNNSENHSYYFGGSLFGEGVLADGVLRGDMQLIKDGEGDLNINSVNAYTGGTILKNGTLVIGFDKSLGSGDVTADGGHANSRRPSSLQ